MEPTPLDEIVERRGSFGTLIDDEINQTEGTMRRPLSEIVKEMGCLLLTDPERIPSSEAAHASLLFAHAAWERATRPTTPGPDYRPLLQQFEASNPGLWSELKSTDAEALVAQLTAYKQARYPDDHRQIVVCGMRGDNVRVEWIDPPADSAAPMVRPSRRSRAWRRHP